MIPKSPVKVRVFSDRPVDINLIWVFVVLLLVVLSGFLVYKYSQKRPSVVCPEQKECPSCNLDCSTCPAKVDYKETVKEVTKYICPSTEEKVDNPDDCVKKQKIYDVQPIKTNEEGTFIQETSIRPACVNGVNGGEVFYKVATTPDTVTFESKEVGLDKEYKTIKSFPGLVTKYRYFTLCSPGEAECKARADFYLDKHKIYLIRIKFDETGTTGKIEYSNEYIIDTTSESDYSTKKCR